MAIQYAKVVFGKLSHTKCTVVCHSLIKLFSDKLLSDNIYISKDCGWWVMD